MSFDPEKFKAELNEAATFAELHVMPVLHWLVTAPEPHRIAELFPDGMRVIQSLGGFENALRVALGDIPQIQAAITAYMIYKQLGGKPMTQEDFDKLEASRGSQE